MASVPGCDGDALWDPAPIDTRIRIGDVGLILNGQFHLLFSAGSPLGERQPGVEVPTTFEELNVGTPKSGLPRPPGCIHTSTVQRRGTGPVDAGFTLLSLEPDERIEFNLTGNCGAALVTKYKTYRKYSPEDLAFRGYTERHYESWVDFARLKGYGDDVHPVLVYGFDMTSDFAMVTYSDKNGAPPARSIAMFPSDLDFFSGLWWAEFLPHTNHGPQERSPPSDGRAIHPRPLQLGSTGRVVSEYNQCVFLQYYTMRSREWWKLFSREMGLAQVGVRPPDPNPGGNRGGAFLGSATPSGTEPTSSDNNLGGQLGITNVVVRNTPYDEVYDSQWNAIADYVFKVVPFLMTPSGHSTTLMEEFQCDIRIDAPSGSCGDSCGRPYKHGGLQLLIFNQNDSHDVAFLLDKNQPQIEVDEIGGQLVGRIVYRGEPSQRLENPTVARTIPSGPLKQLHSLDKASPHFHEQLSSFLHGDEYRNAVPNLQGEDLVWLVEYLDSVIVDISDHTSSAFQVSLRELGKIYGVKEVLPRSYTLSGSITDISLLSSSQRVYAGSLEGSKVRIQRVGMYPGGSARVIKETFYQVAAVWKHLAHRNIVPLLGVTTDPPQLVSDWMPGENLTEYILNHPDVYIPSLLSDVAEGLNYLHSCNVIHGDLKGANILMDTASHARITGFGLATVTQDLDSIRNALAEDRDDAQWIAPEILDGRGTYSKEADIFSFSMVLIEAFTGTAPFGGDSPRAPTLALVDGERPRRPTHPMLTDELWALTQHCWDQEARLRPTALEISRDLAIPPWERLMTYPHTIDERTSLITVILSNPREIEAVRRLRGDVAQSFVDLVDKTSDALVPWLRRECMRLLCKICSSQALLPRSLQIPLPLFYDGEDAVRYYGGSADVHKSEYQGREVAVKLVKVHADSNFKKITPRFYREVMIWKYLHHPNLHSLLGATMGDDRFAMVSEWMVNGNINMFVKAHRDVNRFKLLEDAARGLVYMHGQAMVHGDLKGANILIDNNGHACLTDFGCTTTISDSEDLAITKPGPGDTVIVASGSENFTISSSQGVGGTVRWMSPELFDPGRFGSKNPRLTRESDCYALGMVVLEVLTGRTPFPFYTSLKVIRKVLGGERPGKPRGAEAVWFTDDLWRMLEQCWSSQPNVRPTVETVLECLERGSMAWTPLPPSAEDDLWEDSDGESSSQLSSSSSEDSTGR